MRAWPLAKVVSLQRISKLGHALENQSETLRPKVDELEHLGSLDSIAFRIVEDTCEAIACVSGEELLIKNEDDRIRGR